MEPLDLLILDPGLKDMGSHHHQLNLVVNRYFTSRGVPVIVAANRVSKGKVFPYTVSPAFSYSPYDDSDTTRSKDYSIQVITTAAEVRSIFANRKRPYVLLIHTATSVLLRAIALAIEATGIQHPRSALVELMFRPDSFKMEHPAKLMEDIGVLRYSMALKHLDQAFSKVQVPLKMATSCSEFVDFYSRLVSREIFSHPFALLSEEAAKNNAAAPLERSKAPVHALQVLCFAGDARLNKGMEWITDAVTTHFAKQLAHITFSFQCGGNRFSNSAIERVLTKLAEAKDRLENVIVIDHVVDDNSWHAFLQSFDLIFVLQDPRSYGNRTSGLFWDALLVTSDPATVVLAADTLSARLAAEYALPCQVIKYEDTNALCDVVRRHAGRTGFPPPGHFGDYRKAFYGVGHDRFIHESLCPAKEVSVHATSAPPS
ncbi:MAG: hypothetical protein ACTS6J_14420 [Burkholderiales bacterium]